MKFLKHSVSIIFLCICTGNSFAQAPSPFPPQVRPYAQNPYSVPQAYAPTYPQMMPRQGYLQLAPPALRRAPKKPFKEFSGYLGIALDVLPASLIAQLPEGAKQGILVKKFANNSPAAGQLEAYDVIVAYGSTVIHHPSQFIKLIRNDPPGKKVTIKVIRKGKTLEVPLTLGSQKTPNPKEFNGLAIKQVGKDKYAALVRFVGINGNKQMRSYRGTREEIFEQAISAQDLPQAEREQLLYATRPRQGNSNNSGFGSFFPFGGKNESGKDWMNPSRFFKW